MFSGIVETTSKILTVRDESPLVRLVLARPASFDDLSVGDSIAVNGVCLTLEPSSPEEMEFVLGRETLNITGWSGIKVGCEMNVERSLRFGDRIHGHLVSGHVESIGIVKVIREDKTWREIDIQFSKTLSAFLWRKGSITVNGVSLTINRVADNLDSDAKVFSVGLIPETLKRTNLGLLKVNDSVCLEPDYLVRGLVHFQELKNQELRNQE